MTTDHLRIGIPRPVLESTIYQRAVEAIADDERLAPFRDEPAGTGVILVGPMMASGMPIVNLPAALVAATMFEVAVMSGGLPADEVVKTLINNLQKMRDIAAGKPVGCRLLAGLRGFALPPNTTCDTPFGLLRSADSQWNFWVSGTPRAQPRVAFMTTIPYQITLVQPGAPFPTPQRTLLDEMVEVISRVRLAVLLACDEALAPVRPSLVEITVALPYAGSFGVKPGEEDARPTTDRQLTAAEIADVARFAKALDQQDLSQVDIAIRRTLSAATERASATDILIDAVTAWENLVGTDSETTFRVTASLAHLLEGDYKRRAARFRELKATYDVRSKVVHGERQRPEVVETHASIALGTVLGALRAVLTDESWLLSLPTSRDRADAILLSDPRLRQDSTRQ